MDYLESLIVRGGVCIEIGVPSTIPLVKFANIKTIKCLIYDSYELHCAG